MRKVKFLSTLALVGTAVFGLTACSSSDDAANTTGNADAQSYISVNITNVGSAATRALDGYENGTADESNISKVRFYFFNADGTPYNLTNSTPVGVNYLEKDVTMTGSGDDSKTVENKSNVILVIEGNRGASPATMIAVANPQSLDASTLGTNSLSVDQLRSADLKTTQYATNGKYFVMSNSAYDNNGASTCSALTTNHVYTSQDAAKADPVDIYVERIVAKVSTTKSTATDSKWTTINGKDAYAVGKYGTNTIYAVIDGWGVADENGRTPITKNIGSNSDRTTWASTLGFTPWTTADYHRSFWEISTPFISGGTADNQPQNHSFKSYTSAFGSSLYTFPNTPTEAATAVQADKSSSPTYRTKVLLAAHLMYKNSEGNYVDAPICEYKGYQYISEADVKKVILSENTNIYVKKGDSYSNLTADDITFATPAAGSSLKDYQVTARLVNTTDNGMYYKLNSGAKAGSTNPTDYTGISLADVNTALSASPAEIRHEGMAYYYTSIRHLGAAESNLGYYGVVRNHLYKVTINSIKGFGTPVYDPNRVIVPIVPSNAETYLAARINVLQWRVVTSTVDLDATNTDK